MQCFQVRDESEFAMSSWVLCGKSIVENSDKNLPLLLSPSAFFKTFNDCQKKALKHVALDNLRATENQDEPESVKQLPLSSTPC